MTFGTQRRRSLAAIIAASAIALGSITTATAQAAPQSISWEDCPEGVETLEAKCGRLDVPMNYNDPDGKKISIGLVKLPAKNKSQGSVFVNPGGPGGSVYEMFSNKPVFGFN